MNLYELHKYAVNADMGLPLDSHKQLLSMLEAPLPSFRIDLFFFFGQKKNGISHVVRRATAALSLEFREPFELHFEEEHIVYANGLEVGSGITVEALVQRAA